MFEVAVDAVAAVELVPELVLKVLPEGVVVAAAASCVEVDATVDETCDVPLLTAVFAPADGATLAFPTLLASLLTAPPEVP